MRVLHLCVQCTWSSVLAVDDAMWNRFSSACAVCTKNVSGVLESPEKVLEFSLSKRVGILTSLEHLEVQNGMFAVSEISVSHCRKSMCVCIILDCGGSLCNSCCFVTLT